MADGLATNKENENEKLDLLSKRAWLVFAVGYNDTLRRFWWHSNTTEYSVSADCITGYVDPGRAGKRKLLLPKDLRQTLLACQGGGGCQIDKHLKSISAYYERT